VAYTMYRCFYCGKLTLDKFLAQGKNCSCGSNKYRGAIPKNLFEHLLVFWWALTVR